MWGEKTLSAKIFIKRLRDWQQGINVSNSRQAYLSQWPLWKQYERDIPRLITRLIYTRFLNFLFIYDGSLVLCHFGKSTKEQKCLLSSLSSCHETPSSRQNFVSVFLLHKGGCFVWWMVKKKTCFVCLCVCVCVCVCVRQCVMHSCFAPLMFLLHLCFFFFLKERPCSYWSCDLVMCCYLHCLCIV